MTSTERNTKQGQAIHQVVAGLRQFHTAQEIHAQLRALGEAIGLATVYRRLQAMAEAGEVDAIRAPDGQWAYRACSSGHHHHLICRKCGQTVEIAIDEAWLDSLAAEHGYTQLQHELELYGLCAKCSA
ncbi:MAG: transcriptional repressor [Propionibacteriaceae bacterium]|jgi:Fur family ferric uptake transcriptional regulator|nr:transcriptional repressor [Propionibacteriaceae bacterium]